MKPSVGRMVHYRSYGSPGGEYASLPRAAVVTEVDPDGETVGLCILNPTGQFFTQHVKYSETPKPGHWSWPPRSSDSSVRIASSFSRSKEEPRQPQSAA